ncbi:DUF2262 domain-containing protein [Fusobacterium simiae]|uniref:DUF2262 domain-containing protein n=1 Tax=Fusobacterium simiae TaxID=855 RepID=A0ABT4DFY1_FUSSI|nr:DUF2262 domain-containing protein [Fusobacterium simiae]MCY7007492.1 DUF2262 domain-containing protein [Fusobacterium simiae]
MEKLEEIHKEILNGNINILKNFPLLYCLSENKEDFVVLRKGRVVKKENCIKYFFPNSESNENNGIYCLIWGRKNEGSYGIGGTPVPDNFTIKEMKFENDRLSLLSTKDEKIVATLKQFNKALQKIWSNFTMDELSAAFRQAPNTVLDEIKKENMPNTITIKDFGRFSYKKEDKAYKLVKEEIEYYFSAENKEELKKVKNIFSNIKLTKFIGKAKEYTVNKLLELKKKLWLEEDEKEVTKKDFKDRMKFTSLYVFSESVNFYFDDGNLFWGHAIEVTANQNLEFIDANIVG